MMILDFSLDTVEKRIEFLNKMIEEREQSGDTFTQGEINRMGEYLLHLVDPSLIRTDRMKEAHDRVLKDKVKKGIRSRVYEKEYESVINTNKNEVDVKCIDDNIRDLLELKKLIKTKEHDFFRDRNVSKKKLLTDIDRDVNEMKRGRVLHEVKSHGGEFQSTDCINIDEFKYNRDTLYWLLRNIDHVSQQQPPSNLFYIYLDLCDALSRVKLTTLQGEVLYKIINKEPVHVGKTLDLILKKIIKNI